MSIFSFLGGLLGLGGDGGRRDLNVSKRPSNEGIPIVYGAMRVPNINAFKIASRNNVPFIATNNDDFYVSQVSNDHEEIKPIKEFLHRMDAWAEGPITGIDRFYIDGEAHTASRFSSRPYFRAVTYYGADTQTSYTDLSVASNRWTSAHKGINVAHSAVRFFAHGKVPQFNGEPELHAVVKGGGVYDPRLDSTQVGGSGTHRANDPATWAYSTNRALCTLDYLRRATGRALTDDEIDFLSFMVGGDKSDTAETIPTPLTNTTGGIVNNYWDRLGGIFSNIGIGAFYPSYREWQDTAATTQTRHTLGIALDPKDTVKTNVLKLLNGMKADLQFSQGKYKLIMEDVVGSTVYDFGHDTILGGLKVESGGRSKWLNHVTVEYLNRNKDYKEDTASWPNKQDAQYTTYLADDQGEDLHQTITGDGITDFYEAEALAEYIVRASRIGVKISLKLAPVGSLLEPGDVIGITYSPRSWVDKWFIVDKVKPNADFTANIDAHEYDASVYPWSVKTNEPLNPSDDNPNPWDEPAAVLNLAAVVSHSTKADGTVISGFDVSWDAPTGTAQIDYIEVSWKLDAEMEYKNNIRVAGDIIATSLTGLIDGQTYDIQIMYFTALGQDSLLSEITEALTAAAGTKLGGIDFGATLGSVWGSNISGRPSNLAALSGTEFLNNNDVALSADGNLTYNGGLINIGAVIYGNMGGIPTQLSHVNSGEGTKLTGIAAGADVTATNTAAAIAGQGALATKGSVDLNTAEVTNKSLATLDAASNTKLVGIATDATKNLGSLADKNDVNLAGSFVIGTLPTTKAAAGLKNTGISIASNGTISGAGGGQVTIGGLGFLGHLSATQNNGALADLNVVDTAEIVDRAVSEVQTAFTETEITYSSTSWVEVEAVTITTDADSSVYVLFTSVLANTAASHVDVRVVRGTTELVLRNKVAPSWRPALTIALTDAPGAGTTTYKVEARKDDMILSGDPKLSETSLYVQDLKK